MTSVWPNLLGETSVPESSDQAADHRVSDHHPPGLTDSVRTALFFPPCSFFGFSGCQGCNVLWFSAEFMCWGNRHLDCQNAEDEFCSFRGWPAFMRARSHKHRPVLSLYLCLSVCLSVSVSVSLSCSPSERGCWPIQLNMSVSLSLSVTHTHTHSRTHAHTHTHTRTHQ